MQAGPWDFLFLNRNIFFQPVTQSAISIWGQSFRQNSFSFFFCSSSSSRPFFFTQLTRSIHLMKSHKCVSLFWTGFFFTVRINRLQIPIQPPGCKIVPAHIIEDISSFPPLSVSGKNSRRGSDILVWCRAKPRIRCALDASASMAYVFHLLSSKSGDRSKKTSFSFSPRPLLFRFPFSYLRCCKITRSIH